MLLAGSYILVHYSCNAGVSIYEEERNADDLTKTNNSIANLYKMAKNFIELFFVFRCGGIVEVFAEIRWIVEFIAIAIWATHVPIP